MWPLTEAMALQLIKGKGYGKTRLFCAVSWGLCSFFVGYIIDRSSYGIDLVFYLTWSIMFLNVVILVACIPSPENLASVHQNDRQDARSNRKLNSAGGPAEEGRSVEAGNALPTTAAERKGSKQEDNSIVSNLQVFILDPNLQQFYLILGVYGFCFSLVESLLFIVLEKDYHASKTIQGLCIAVSVIFEIPVFHFSDSLLEKYGVKRMFVIAQSACALRLILYYLTPISNPEMVVFIQLLHGFCFAVMWVAAVQYAKANAPRKLQNTSQTVMSNVWVVGNGCGSFFWSFLYDRFDNFRICYISGGLFVGCLAYYTFKYWNVKVNRTKQ